MRRLISDIFKQWEEEYQQRFNTLKSDEEELKEHAKKN